MKPADLEPSKTDLTFLKYTSYSSTQNKLLSQSNIQKAYIPVLDGPGHPGGHQNDVRVP